jgi:adenylyl cyclase-associated protein
VTLKQQVYLFNCRNATIIIDGKCKTICVDSCVKSKCIFDNAVSAIEVVNSKQMQVQCRGIVPSVAIDKTDGILVYLSHEGAHVTQFVTSKSSEMNVAFPKDAASDEYLERPIPEQFVHTIARASQTVTSTVSDLYSH